MSRRRDEWYGDGHPPACTCVACNNRRLGSLSSGQGGEGGRRGGIGTADWPRDPQRGGESKSWLKRFFVGAVLIVVTGLIGFFAIHYSQGANGSDAAAMVLDDVRVLTT